MKNEETIFAEAMGIESADARSAYLDKACGGDSALRQQVEALLAAIDRAGAFMQSPAPTLGGTAAADSSGASSAAAHDVEPLGTTVGLSGTLTFLSLLVWSTILGGVGAFLAVPATLFVKALFIDVDPDRRWLTPLLSSNPTEPVPAAPGEPVTS